MSLSKEEINKALTAIKNKLNEDRFDDERIEHYTSFIFADRKGIERSEKEKDAFLSLVLDDHSRSLYRDLSHISITKDGWKRYFINIKRNGQHYQIMDLAAYGEHEMEMLEDINKSAEKLNTIFRRGYVESTVEFPTGELMFANFFKNTAQDDYAFEVPEDLKYKRRYSINHALGEQNTMDILSKEHGLCYVQLGNRTAAIYKASDDRIIMTSSFLYYYDEETDEEQDIPVPEGWQLMGSICCDVWRVECIDKANFDKGDALPLDHEGYQYNEPFTGKVNPGKWRVRNYYHLMDDDEIYKQKRIPIWVELERIGE